MQIKKSGVRRGNWKVFLQLSISNLTEGSVLTAIFQAPNGVTMPCTLVPEVDSSGVPIDEGLYVLVVPDLSLSQAKAIVVERDALGGIIDSQEIDLKFGVLKWESRLGYKVNPVASPFIRDIDQVLAYSAASIDFWSCIDDEDSYILRCTLNTPYRTDSKLNITCYTASMSKVDMKVVPFGQNVRSLEFFKEKQQLQSQYSLRIPHVFGRYYFVLEDVNHPDFNAFECLTPEKLGQLSEASSHLFLHAQVDPRYPGWFQEHKATKAELAKQRIVRFKNNYLFSVIVPLYNTPIKFFIDMVESVQNQTYSNWELVLVNASPDNRELVKLVAQVSSCDKRIKTITLDENMGISENTNAGIAMASGDFICFFDHDDVIEPDLLFSYAEVIEHNQDAVLLYCDEDKLLTNGKYSQPFFKPDFNIDLLRNNNYICHMLTIKKSLLDEIEPNTREFDGAQDHNLTLRVAEKVANDPHAIVHVPKVLYHWRLSETSTAANADSKPYATIAGIRAVQSHLTRLGLKATVSQANRPFTYKVIYDVPENHPLISIIIPTKDHVDILKTCLESIWEKTSYDNYEILVIENNSTDPETFKFYETLEADEANRTRVVYWKNEFNFSKLMNFGAQNANGEYLLLLNNDTEVITTNWIEVMLGLCAREDVGVVGVKLYYPDKTIQHAGLCVTGTAAGILCQSMPKRNWGYNSFNDAQQDMSAVTAACMMTKKSIFEQVGGFTTDLQVAFNDVDYCLKVRDLDKLVVYTPEVELYHYESISRGAENNTDKKIRFHREVAYMNYRWAKYYVKGDPYFNPNFVTSEPYSWYYHI